MSASLYSLFMGALTSGTFRRSSNKRITAFSCQLSADSSGPKLSAEGIRMIAGSGICLLKSELTGLHALSLENGSAVFDVSEVKPHKESKNRILRKKAVQTGSAQTYYLALSFDLESLPNDHAGLFSISYDRAQNDFQGLISIEYRDKGIYLGFRSGSGDKDFFESAEPAISLQTKKGILTLVLSVIAGKELMLGAYLDGSHIKTYDLETDEPLFAGSLKTLSVGLKANLHDADMNSPHTESLTLLGMRVVIGKTLGTTDFKTYYRNLMHRKNEFICYKNLLKLKIFPSHQQPSRN